MELPQTLLVTNDFPPRVGGIQRTLEALCRHLPSDRISVLAPHWPEAETYGATAAFRVFRDSERFMWPGPNLRRAVERLIEELGAEVVVFGDVFPLARLGTGLAEAGTPYLVATHGFDYWLAALPGTNALMRRMTAAASRVPVMCSEFIARRVRTGVPPHVPVDVLYPGADLDVFRPDLQTEDLRERHGLGERPLIVCVSRLVARKGQDTLIRGMRAVHRRMPDAALLIVGGGPDEQRLRRLAEDAPKGTVLFAGQVSERDLPRYYALGDVFAMPCRSRLGGLEVEGWGNVFIEAAACARPVVVGDSGGASEALVDGETGLLVDGRDEPAVADAVASLLEDPGLARKMGEAGRARVESGYTWPRAASQLAGWIREAVV